MWQTSFRSNEPKINPVPIFPNDNWLVYFMCDLISIYLLIRSIRTKKNSYFSENDKKTSKNVIFTYHLIVRSDCVNLRKLVTIVIQPVTHSFCLFSTTFLCIFKRSLFTLNQYYYNELINWIPFHKCIFSFTKNSNISGVSGKRNVCQRSSFN